MINKIRTFKGQVFLNLLNVDYKATEKDLLEAYSHVRVKKIEETDQRGIFLLLVENAEEAIKLFAGEEKVPALKIAGFFFADRQRPQDHGATQRPEAQGGLRARRGQLQPRETPGAGGRQLQEVRRRRGPEVQQPPREGLQRLV